MRNMDRQPRVAVAATKAADRIPFFFVLLIIGAFGLLEPQISRSFLTGLHGAMVNQAGSYGTSSR